MRASLGGGPIAEIQRPRQQLDDRENRVGHNLTRLVTRDELAAIGEEGLQRASKPWPRANASGEATNASRSRLGRAQIRVTPQRPHESFGPVRETDRFAAQMYEGRDSHPPCSGADGAN